MSSYIGIVRGNGREAFVAEHPEITGSRVEAQRFDTSMEARLAAERLTRVITGAPNDWHRMYPWISEVDAEEVE